MKTAFLCSIFFLCSCTLFAQSYIFDAGSLALNGSASYVQAQYDNKTEILTTLHCQVGIFLAPKFETGISFRSISSTPSVFSLYGRHYFCNSTSTFAPFIGTTLGFSTSTNSNSSASLGVEGGIAYILGKNVTANVSLAYITTEQFNATTCFAGLGIYLW